MVGRSETAWQHGSLTIDIKTVRASDGDCEALHPAPCWSNCKSSRLDQLGCGVRGRCDIAAHTLWSVWPIAAEGGQLDAVLGASAPCMSIGLCMSALQGNGSCCNVKVEPAQAHTELPP